MSYAPDRQLRRRRLLDGGRQPAARRVRARPHRQGAAARCASCRRRAATPTTTSSASTAHFPPGAASPAHLSLFRRERAPAEPREHLLAQDLIYVGGGSVTSLLGVWRAHGIDEILREAGSAGVVLCGLSAGSLCWFAEGVSTFHGPPQRVEGLGLLPWSNTVHYRPSRTRREALFGWLREGMAPAYAADDGAALHFVGDEVAQVVASRPAARAYRVELRHGHVVTTQLATRYLGDDACVPLVRPQAGRWPRASRDGLAADASSRSAGTSSRASAATRRCATTCSGSPDAARPASACCRPPAATRPSRSPPFAPASAELDCRLSHVSLFRLGDRDGRPRASHLLAQDLIYVGGGSMRQPAGDLARARDRPDPARGAGSGESCSPARAPGPCAGSRRASPARRASPGWRQALASSPGALSVHYHRDPRPPPSAAGRGRRRRAVRATGSTTAPGSWFGGQRPSRPSAPGTARPSGASSRTATAVRASWRWPTTRLRSSRPAIDELPDAVIEMRELRRGATRGAWSRR